VNNFYYKLLRQQNWNHKEGNTQHSAHISKVCLTNYGFLFCVNYLEQQPNALKGNLKLTCYIQPTETSYLALTECTLLELLSYQFLQLKD